MSAIDDKWNELQANGVDLGDSLAPEAIAPDGRGRYKHFRGGSIYWSPESGAHEVHGSIRDRWESLGWERGHLGYPLTDETSSPDENGRFTHFQGGSIYWSPQTGAHEVHGAILEHWGRLGWEVGFLGYPLTDETETEDGIGRFNRFQNGAIYWTPDTGAHEVHGGIKNEWVRLGAARSWLGYPISDETSTPDSSGRFNLFTGGAIYWNQQTGNSYAVRMKTPLLGQPALVAPDLDRGSLPSLAITFEYPSPIPELFMRMQPYLFRQIWGDRLFLRSVVDDVSQAHEVPLSVEPLAGHEVFTPSQMVGSANLAGGSIIRERTLYDLCLRNPDGTVVIVSPHCVYARSSWDAFGFTHITDLHVSRRLDSIRQQLQQLNKNEGATAFNNPNDAFRDFVAYANRLHDSGRLDLVLATGDLVDYLFEDGENRAGPGNFGFFTELVRGASAYPEGRPAQALRVPIFTSLGNHDYRANAYPLLSMARIGVDDFVGEIADVIGVGQVFDALGRVIERIPIWGPLFGRSTPHVAFKVPLFDHFNLTEDEARALVGARDFQGFSLIPAYGEKQALRWVEISAPMKEYTRTKAKPPFYFSRINRDSSYVIRAGAHRFVMLDTRWDAGTLSGVWDGLWALLGYGGTAKTEFAAKRPQSVGATDDALTLVAQAQNEAGANGLVVMGMHAPLLNPQGNEYSHYFRETEHAGAAESETVGFLYRHEPELFTKAVRFGDNTLTQNVNPATIHREWLRNGTAHFKEGRPGDRLGSLMDNSIAIAKNKELLEYCVGAESARPIDLVLFGHVHRNVEFRLGYNAATRKMLFFHDYYTENPTEYYASTATNAAGDFRTNRTIRIFVDADVNPRNIAHRVRDDAAGYFKEEWRLAVDRFARPLDGTTSASVARQWWDCHRPLLLQTGPLGLLDKNQRPDVVVPLIPNPAAPDSERPTRPSPSFQGLRVVSVENNTMTRISYVKRADL